MASSVRHMTEDAIRKAAGLSRPGSEREGLAQLASVTSLNLNRSGPGEAPIKHIDCLELLPRLTTLNLSGNRIDRLDGLMKAPALSDLDLSDNGHVKDLRPLTRLRKLRSLNLAGNSLSHLPSSLATCSSLSLLDLSSNAISALGDIETALAPLSSLSSLSLAGNPIAGLPHYREFVIYTLPSLTTLDSTPISDSERSNAARRFGREQVSSLTGQLQRAQAANRLLRLDYSRSEARARQLESTIQDLNASLNTAKNSLEETREALRVKTVLLDRKTSELTRTQEDLFALRQDLEYLRIERDFAASSGEGGDDSFSLDHEWGTTTDHTDLRRGSVLANPAESGEHVDAVRSSFSTLSKLTLSAMALRERFEEAHRTKEYEAARLSVLEADLAAARDTVSSLESELSTFAEVEAYLETANHADSTPDVSLSVLKIAFAEQIRRMESARSDVESAKDELAATNDLMTVLQEEIAVLRGQEGTEDSVSALEQELLGLQTSSKDLEVTWEAATAAFDTAVSTSTTLEQRVASHPDSPPGASMAAMAVSTSTVGLLTSKADIKVRMDSAQRRLKELETQRCGLQEAVEAAELSIDGLEGALAASADERAVAEEAVRKAVVVYQANRVIVEPKPAADAKTADSESPELAHALETVEKLRSELDEANSEIGLLREQAEQHQDSAAPTSSELDEEIAAKSQRLVETKQLLDGASAMYSQLREKIVEASETHEKQVAVIEAAIVKEREVEASIAQQKVEWTEFMTGEQASMDQAVAAHKEELAALRAEAAAIQQEAGAGLSRSNSVASGTMRSAGSERSQLEASLAAAGRIEAELDDRLEKLAAGKSQVAAAAAAADGALREENDRLRKALDMTQEKISSLMELNADYAKQVQECNDKVAEAESDLAELNSALSECQWSLERHFEKEHARKLMEENEALKTEIDDLRAGGDGVDSAETRAELVAAQEKIEELVGINSGFKAQLASMRAASVTQQSAAQAQADSSNDSETMLRAALEKSQDKIKELVEVNESFAKEMEIYQAKVAESESDLADLRSALSECQWSLERHFAEERAARLQEENDKLKDEVDSLTNMTNNSGMGDKENQAEIAELSSQLEDAHEKMKELKGMNAAFRAQLSAVKKPASAATAAVAATTADSGPSKSKNEDEGDIERLRHALKLSQEKIQQLADERSIYAKEVEDCQNKVAESEEDIQELRVALDECHVSLEKNLGHEARVLFEENTALKERLSRMEKDLAQARASAGPGASPARGARGAAGFSSPGNIGASTSASGVGASEASGLGDDFLKSMGRLTAHLANARTLITMLRESVQSSTNSGTAEAVPVRPMSQEQMSVLLGKLQGDLANLSEHYESALVSYGANMARLKDAIAARDAEIVTLKAAPPPSSASVGTAGRKDLLAVLKHLHGLNRQLEDQIQALKSQQADGSSSHGSTQHHHHASGHTLDFSKVLEESQAEIARLQATRAADQATIEQLVGELEMIETGSAQHLHHQHKSSSAAAGGDDALSRSQDQVRSLQARLSREVAWRERQAVLVEEGINLHHQQPSNHHQGHHTAHHKEDVVSPSAWADVPTFSNDEAEFLRTVNKVKNMKIAELEGSLLSGQQHQQQHHHGHVGHQFQQHQPK